MKKILLLSTIFFLSISAFAQWNPLNLISSNTCYHSSFPSNDTGYVASTNIYRTFDGGLNFDSVSVPNMAIYNSIYFRTKTDGAVCGTMNPSGSGIFRTINAGLTWQDITATNALGSLIDVRFADAIHGTLLTSAPGLLNTANAGVTWDTLTFGYDYFNSLVYPTATTGYIGGFDGTFNYKGVICKTTDAGLTWNIVSAFTQQNTDIMQLFFVSADTGFATLTTWQQPAKLLRTYDGAATWDTVNFNYGQISRFTATDYLNIFVVNDSGSIYRSVDAGLTWTYDRAHTYTIYDITASPDYVYAFGANGLAIKRNVLSGISSMEFNGGIKIYPNPGTDQTTISLPHGTTMQSVSAMNVLGKNCGALSFVRGNADEIVINTQSLAKGFYILEIATKNEILKVKFEKTN